MVLSVAGQAVPIFWLALMLIWLFAVQLEWLPVFGSGTARHLVLPALSLSTIVLGRLARLVRSSMSTCRSGRSETRMTVAASRTSTAATLIHTV